MTLSSPTYGSPRQSGRCGAAGLQPLDEWSIRLPCSSRVRPEFERLGRQMPGRLRRITVARLRFWGLDALAEEAALLVSELVTNALQHGTGEVISFRLARMQDHVLIAITDGTPWRPELRDADELDEGGRGLMLVAALAENWGYDEKSTTMWCSLSAPAKAVEAC